MNSNKTVTAIFRIEYPDAECEETVALLGSDKSLGRWSLQEPVFCYKVRPDMWEATVTLTPGTTVHWCCIIIDIRGSFIKRETHPRRRTLSIDEDCARLEINGEWNDTMDITQIKALSEHPPNVPEPNAVPESSIGRKLMQFIGNETTTAPKGREILATFVIRRRLRPGEDTLAIIGSPKSLGEWRATHVAYGQYIGGDQWEIVTPLTAGTTVFWSCVTLDKAGSLVRRELAPRRRKLTVEFNSPNLTLTGAWNEVFAVNFSQNQKKHAVPLENQTNTSGVWSVLTTFFSTIFSRHKYRYASRKVFKPTFEASSWRTDGYDVDADIAGAAIASETSRTPMIPERSGDYAVPKRKGRESPWREGRQPLRRQERQPPQRLYTYRWGEDSMLACGRGDLLRKVGRSLVTGFFSFLTNTQYFGFW